MALVIAHLSDYPEHLDTVVDWLWQEWGQPSSRPYYESLVRHSLTKGQLPLTFVALQDDELVGTVGLWRSDLLCRQDLYPWMAALYVRKDDRGRGIGQQLQRFVMAVCQEQGFGELYLYTDLHGYYERSGWQYLTQSTTSANQSVRVYRMALDEA